MKHMNLIIVVASLFLIAGSAFGGGVAEQGSIEAGAFYQFGNDFNGGYAVGSVNGSYRAEDRNEAWGGTEGSVFLKGQSFEADHIAKSSAFGKVDSAAAANGHRLSEVAINGEVTQANWTFLTDGDNFALAGNKTKADYEGSRDGRGFTGAEGSAMAGGESYSFLKSSSTETKAAAGTKGFSEGTLSVPCGDPSANGFGQAAINIGLTSGNASGAAYAEGNSNYSAQGPTAARGSLQIATEGSIKILPDGIKVTAGAASTSKTSSR